MNLFRVKYLTLLVLPAVLFACSGEQNNDGDEHLQKNQPPLKIISPLNEDDFTVGDIIEVQIEVNKPTEVKNLELYFADTLYQTGLDAVTQTIQIDTKNGNVGFTKIHLSYQTSDGEQHGDTRKIVLFSDTAPVQKKAVIVKSYVHDKSSYTQGLEFNNNQLFEGTGQLGQSILAEVNLNTGQILRKISLEPSYFGEGITILNDTIYQITWTDKTCFVYDLNFNKIREMNYEGEGWGLCNDGTYIIMSNGTNEIVWRDPHTFEIVKQLYVFSDQSDYSNLNELELINGNLFINVYTEDYIVEVDTAYGKVLSVIDCADIVIDGRVPGADVLNGIAHHKSSGKTYLTGKWWPKLYEVKFEEVTLP
ncbi:MAG: glutaminyl-peptide cyclotransferase [Crocinitomicaceae bacterium]|nr:glutaminyl-peptide cyclotransferase [Crocinitomicaceae bacterium]MBK8927592.1 glutaminyl-peptide cyclotransferase [Crocinitomicaceae bacterium]